MSIKGSVGILYVEVQRSSRNIKQLATSAIVGCEVTAVGS